MKRRAATGWACCASGNCWPLIRPMSCVASPVKTTSSKRFSILHSGPTPRPPPHPSDREGEIIRLVDHVDRCCLAQRDLPSPALRGRGRGWDKVGKKVYGHVHTAHHDIGRAH